MLERIYRRWEYQTVRLLPKVEEDGKSWLRRLKLYKSVVEPCKENKEDVTARRRVANTGMAERSTERRVALVAVTWLWGGGVVLWVTVIYILRCERCEFHASSWLSASGALQSYLSSPCLRLLPLFEISGDAAWEQPSFRRIVSWFAASSEVGTRAAHLETISANKTEFSK